jgi:hypothetical protein
MFVRAVISRLPSAIETNVASCLSLILTIVYLGALEIQTLPSDTTISFQSSSITVIQYKENYRFGSDLSRLAA